MKAKRERKTGKQRFAAAAAAVVLLAGSVSSIYGAERENAALEFTGDAVSTEKEVPADSASMEIQQPEPAVTESRPVSTPDGPDSLSSESAPAEPGTEVSGEEPPTVDFTSDESEGMQGEKGDSGQAVLPPQQEDPDKEKPGPDITVTPVLRPEEPEKPEGSLSITREKLEKGIRANSDFRITVLLKNTWTDGDIQRGKMNLELPGELYLHPDYKKETFDIPDLRPGMTRKVTVRLRAGAVKEDGRTLRMKVRVSFRHQLDGALQEQQEVLLLPVHTDDSKGVFVDNTASYSAGGEFYGGGDASAGEKKKADPMVPRIIVSQFGYDKDAFAGKDFKTSITVCNTSEKLNVENMVMSIEAGEATSLQGTSNTLYVKKLKPQETYRTEFTLKTQEDGKTDRADVTFNFKYEYMKNEERTEVESAQKIAIPVQIPDRFSTGELQTSDDTIQGEEFAVSLPYVNKGKIPVSNVEAVIKTDMKAGETYKYLGNVEAGSNGTLDFFVTPEESGDQKVHITLTYENSAGQEKTVEKEKIFRIAEAEPEVDESMSGGDGMETEKQAETGGKMKKGILAAGGSGLIFGSAAGFWRMRKRKRTREENEEF